MEDKKNKVGLTKEQMMAAGIIVGVVVISVAVVWYATRKGKVPTIIDIPKAPKIPVAPVAVPVVP